MKNLKIIDDIFKYSGIKLWGKCSFEYLKDKLIPCRAINKIPENSNTVLCCLFPYAVKDRQHNISKYAFSNDYHIIVSKFLNTVTNKLIKEFPNFKFSYFCDNSPIPEVYAAALCGLGYIGKNGLLINENYGSFVFIGEIVTDMPLTYKKSISIKSCDLCDRCINSCPGNALSNTCFNKNLCASFLSQKKGKLTPSEEQIVANTGLVWGCDICQDVCPMNKHIKTTYIEEFEQDIYPLITSKNYNMIENRAFSWRPLEVIRRNIYIQEKR